MQQSSAKPQGRQKVLVVEDDLAISSMYKMKLESRGYEVRTAFDGKKGLELSKSFLPDLILLDILLPEMNGDEMLQKLRATEWGASIRIVVLTNLSKDEAPAGLRLLHVDRYIVKAHHTPSQMVEVVAEVFKENGKHA